MKFKFTHLLNKIEWRYFYRPNPAYILSGLYSRQAQISDTEVEEELPKPPK